VPINTLRTTPYNLPWGSSINAKVTAINKYGNSVESEVGNGAIILTYPDPPVNLIEDWTVKSESHMVYRLNDELSATGGTPFLDYRVSFD